MPLADFQAQGVDGSTTISFSAVFSSCQKLVSDITARLAGLQTQQDALIKQMAADVVKTNTAIAQIDAIHAVQALVDPNSQSGQANQPGFDQTVQAGLDAAQASDDFINAKAQSDQLSTQAGQLQPLLTQAIGLMSQMTDHFSVTPFFVSSSSDQAFLSQIATQEEGIGTQVSALGIPFNPGPIAAPSTFQQLASLGRSLAVVTVVVGIIYVAFQVYKIRSLV